MDPQMMMLLFAGEKGLSGLASGFGQYESEPVILGNVARLVEQATADMNARLKSL